MLHGLGNAVHRPEGEDQPWGGAVHRLVVRAVDGEAGAVEGVEQAARLGAYRVGTGDGGVNPDSVSGWSTGSALAAQVEDLRQQAAGGWALYRYGSLFGPEAPALAEAECAALRALNG